MKSIQKHYKIFLSIVISAISCGVHGQSLLCLKERISGFESEHSMAVYVLLKNTPKVSYTSDIKKVSIFVTCKNMYGKSYLYLHSNYKPTGHQNAVKFATDGEKNIRAVTKYMMDVGGYQYEFSEAYKDNIQFIVDYRVFHNSKFKNIDFGEATKIKVSNATGVINADGYKVFRTQTELKKAGLYKGIPDGITNPSTDKAVNAYKKSIGINDADKIYLYSKGDKKGVYYQKVDEFLHRFEKVTEICTSPFSLCLTRDMTLSFVAECNGQSIEFSTNGEVTLTASNGNETYTVTLNGSATDKKTDTACAANNMRQYENPVQFLKCYESASVTEKNMCEQTLVICLGKKSDISFELNCYGNTISASTSGSITLTSAKGKSASIEF